MTENRIDAGGGKDGNPSFVSGPPALAGVALGLFGARLLVSPKSVVTAHEAGLQQTTVVIELDS